MDCPLCKTYPSGTLCVRHGNPELTHDAHPTIREARELLLLEEQYRLQAQDDAFMRMWRCVVLAPTLSICRSLIRGEHVPTTLLDQTWLRRFRRKQAA